MRKLKWKEKYVYLNQLNHVILGPIQAKIFLRVSANKLIRN